MLRPLVSIILPVKNGARFLAEGISSVLSQDYHPLELIVIDGQSTDGSVEIIRSFPEAKYSSQTSVGINQAWNQGIDQASGEYIGFMGSDDIWEPDKIQKQIRYFKENPEILCSITMVEMFLEPGVTPPPSFRMELLGNAYPGYMLEALLAHRSIFKQIGGFLTDMPGPQDLDWWLRLKDSSKTVGIIRETLVYKRIHDLNLSYTEKPIHTNSSLLRAMQRSIKRKRNSGAEDAD